MKTIDQIARYASQCQFTDDDWQKVLQYAKENHKGGRLHRSPKPISNSTYEQFLDWVGNGFGTGDMVAYGKTMGIIGDWTPEKAILAAYCDFEGNLVVKDMQTKDPQRLTALEPQRKKDLEKLMQGAGMCFSERIGKVMPILKPKERSYIAFTLSGDKSPKIGMYSHSEHGKQCFYALLDGSSIKLDCCVDIGLVPIRYATDKEIQRFHHAIAKTGYSYNARENAFIKSKPLSLGGKYWYLSDKFTIIQDKDNGAARHKERYDAGNYFIDYGEALIFLKRLKKLRLGEI